MYFDLEQEVPANMESSAFTRVSEILSERVSELSPFALLLALFAASAIYYFSKQYFQYRVSSERAVLFTAPFAKSQQSDVAIGARHGCQPPPELPSRWPLGMTESENSGLRTRKDVFSRSCVL